MRSKTVGILLLAAGIFAAAACVAPGLDSPSPMPSLNSEPARAEAGEGPYRLVFEMPATAWRAGETITGEARIELLEGEPVEVAGSSGPGLLGFEFTEVGGRREVTPVWTADCGSREVLGVRDPVVFELRPTGGASSPDDPDWDWHRQFMTRPKVQLPAGEWDITAIARFNEAWDCPPRDATVVGLVATIRVLVVP